MTIGLYVQNRIIFINTPCMLLPARMKFGLSFTEFHRRKRNGGDTTKFKQLRKIFLRFRLPVKKDVTSLKETDPYSLYTVPLYTCIAYAVRICVFQRGCDYFAVSVSLLLGRHLARPVVTLTR